MRLAQTFSGAIVLILALVFAFSTYNKMKQVYAGERTCICAYDGFGYYMYLPYFFNHGNLNIQKVWAQDAQDKYCRGIPAYQLETYEGGNYINIYHMGLAFVQLPSYLIADITARVWGYEATGFSSPYRYAYLINAWLFILLSLLYLRKLLRQFVNDNITGIVIVIIVLGANTYYTFKEQYDLPHLYLFAINAASLYHLVNYLRTESKRSILFAALLFGLSVSIRPTQALFGIIPLLLIFNKHSFKASFWKHIALFPAAAFLCNIPQLLYWKITGGDWVILNLHTEDLVFTDPNLTDFLFSYRKGWLLYSPVFLLLLPGLYFTYLKERRFFWAILLFTGIYIYTMSSWECWWYSSSFGSRAMVDIYPVLAVALAILLSQVIRNKIALIVLGTFALSCIALNLLQSLQLERGILDPSRMTKEHYWLVFGKTDPGSVHHRFILMDKSNPNWPMVFREHPDHPFKIKERFIHGISSTVVSEAQQHVLLGKLHLYETFETPETWLEVSLKFRTSDSTQSSLLRLESFSEYNYYSWDVIELSLGRSQNTVVYDTLRFNLPWIRHTNDSIQMYIWNDGNARIELMQFDIKSTSLIRP